MGEFGAHRWQAIDAAFGGPYNPHPTSLVAAQCALLSTTRAERTAGAHVPAP
jgi:hypothetical protein